VREQTIVSVLSHNEIVREGLRRILTDQGFAVIQTVAEAHELNLSGEAGPVAELIIVDANAFSEGVLSCEQVRARHPDLRIVLMVDEYDIDHIAKAFATGAVDGYLVKTIPCEPLGAALRLVSMGEKIMPSQLVESFTDSSHRLLPMTWDINCGGLNLSNREVEILRCLLDGDANKVISRRLHITDATVKVHIKAILRKLRVKNRTQAAIWAVSRGLGREDMATPPAHMLPIGTSPEPMAAISH
jgi:two-component system, NarL family, nitrate/nitrite response regulator NarL